MTKKILTLALFASLFQGCSQFPQKSDIGLREIRIAIWIDEDDYEPASINIAKEAVIYASNAFNIFKIKFTVNSLRPWQLLVAEDGRLDCSAILADAEKLGTLSPPSDIILGYTSKPIFLNILASIDGEDVIAPKPVYGCAKNLKKAAIIQINKLTNNCTLHELLHIFGAKDLLKPEKSIMHSLEIPDPYIDKQSFALVLKNRNRTF